MNIIKNHESRINMLIITHIFTIILVPSSTASAFNLLSTFQDNLSLKNYISVDSNNITSYVKSLKASVSTIEYGDFKDLANTYIGYFEEYEIVTEDNYILKVFRIPGNVSNIVLLSHGLFCTADDFLLIGNISMMHMLAERGFDIWALNYRGNRYSRKHKTLNPDIDARFWQYSMHELGYYDLPAVIDFILKKTGQSQLSLVGHSEGTSISFVLLSTRPQYNKKIKLLIALAPVVYISDPNSSITDIIGISSILVALAEIFNFNELLAFHSNIKDIIDIICSSGNLGYLFCVNAIGFLSRTGQDWIELEYLFKILGHYPAGSSKKNVEHLSQIAMKKTFAQFDYGPIQNIMIYGRISPPKYDMQNIVSKTALIVSQNDGIVGLKEAEQIKRSLPNVINYTVVSYEKFSHVDFLYSSIAYKVVYPTVVNLLKTNV